MNDDTATTVRTEGEPLRIAVIIGSIREDRFGPVPAAWIAGEAERREDLEVDLIDLAETGCPHVLAGNDPDGTPEPVAALGKRLERADAFVLVTPVYNRGYPASLKNAIDWFYSEWTAKPVGFVSYGGITGGLQAVDQLRTVMNEFHAVPLRDPIMFINFWDKFDHDGRPVDTELARSLSTGFLDHLTWWGLALRDARAARPFPAELPS